MEHGYPKVEEFLSNITLGTKIIVFDGEGDYQEKILFEGTVADYHNSDMVKQDLVLVWSTIEDNTFVIEALEDGHPDTIWGSVNV